MSNIDLIKERLEKADKVIIPLLPWETETSFVTYLYKDSSFEGLLEQLTEEQVSFIETYSASDPFFVLAFVRRLLVGYIAEEQVSAV